MNLTTHYCLNRRCQSARRRYYNISDSGDEAHHTLLFV